MASETNQPCETVPIGGKGRPLQLLELNEDGKTFSLDEDVLKDFLQRNERFKELNVAVISIAGGFRGGKSFLLNFFLRYLEHMSREEDNSDQTSTPMNEMSSLSVEERPSLWMGDENAPLAGFKWELGVDRVTSGIQIWSEVFRVTLSDGEKVAIILLDTQGLSDHHTTHAMNCKIYALSSMISSVQILNLRNNVRDDDLQFIKFCTEYSSLSAQVCQSRMKPSFQKLLLLVRDWFYDFQYAYGSEGGQQYIDKEVLNVSGDKHEELKAVREQITSAFDVVAGFLMPHPGLRVASNPKFDGKLSDIEPDFKQSLQKLISSILSPENLIPKEMNGRRVKVRELFEYLCTYVEVLNQNEELEPKSLIQANIETSQKDAKEAALESYEAAMREVYNPTTPFVETNFLWGLHTQSSRTALEKFEECPKFGSDTDTSIYREKLKRDMKKAFQVYLYDNDMKKKLLDLQEEIQREKEMEKNKKNEEKIRRLQEKYERLEAEKNRSWFARFGNILFEPLANLFSGFLPASRAVNYR